MLKVENLSKKYGSFTALEEISLQFNKGIYGLLAPNGAGKTTLIKMLVTLIRPTGGSIMYEGQEIGSLGETYRERIGYLPQHFGYYRHYSPQKYLRYLAVLKGMDKKMTDSRIDEVLGLVGLKDVKHKKMRKFSGGMIQRVGIAQALLSNPQILILDEPTAGLDPRERARFRHLLSDLARDRMILISTHIVSDIESIANEIIMIRDKKVLYKDSVEAICSTLSGKVFEHTVPYDQASLLRERFLALGEKQEHGKLTIRFVADRKEPDWTPVTPQLEDVFLKEYEYEKTGV